MIPIWGATSSGTRTAPQSRLVDSARGLIRLVPVAIKIKLIFDARCHRLMMLAEIKEKAMRSSRKNMDGGAGIIFLHCSHMMGNLFGERGGVLAARDTLLAGSVGMAYETNLPTPGT